MSTREKIKQQIAALCAVPAARIRSDAMLIEYGLDSIRSIELVVALEEAFGIEIPDTVMERMRTVSDVFGAIECRVCSQSEGENHDLPIAA